LVASIAPACSSTANISDVWTALEGDGARRRNVFFTDTKEIHCLVEMGIGRDDVTFELIIRARQVYNPATRGFDNLNFVALYHEERPPRTDGTPRVVSTQLVPVGADGQPAEDAPYPAGRYECEAYIDGVLQGSAVFNVGFPPCPPAAIPNNARCGGFYEEGKDCPAFGDTGDQDLRCRCVGGVWQC
jgi:hypothetical protein